MGGSAIYIVYDNTDMAEESDFADRPLLNCFLNFLGLTRWQSTGLEFTYLKLQLSSSKSTQMLLNYMYRFVHYHHLSD